MINELFTISTIFLVYIDVLIFPIMIKTMPIFPILGTKSPSQNVHRKKNYELKV